MADPVFFPRPEPLSVAEIAALTGAVVAEGADTRCLIDGVAPLDLARRGDASFIENGRYRGALEATGAGACFCHRKLAEHVPAGTIALVTSTPQKAYAKLAARFFPTAARPQPTTGTTGISPTAHIDPTARIEDGVTIEAGAIVSAGAEIGRGSLVGPYSIVGPNVRVGRDCVIGANSTIVHALIGNRVVLHPGVRIGQDGFGYVPGADSHTKVVQLGRVIVQDDVEIGANSCVDRGSGRDTVIGEGTKIDNLVQIGHNTTIGRHCLIAGQAGISGSVTIEDFVIIGGSVGIRDHVRIGRGAQIAGKAGVRSDIDGGAWSGDPAVPIQAYMAQLRALARLTRGRDRKREGGPTNE